MKTLVPTLLASVTALSLAVSVAVAQTPPAVPANPNAPATPPAGMPGTANNPDSAQKQIEASGYTNVRNLKRQDDGTWRATATKNNAEVAIAVDSTGNVTQIEQ